MTLTEAKAFLGDRWLLHPHYKPQPQHSPPKGGECRGDFPGGAGADGACGIDRAEKHQEGEVITCTSILRNVEAELSQNCPEHVDLSG